MQKCDARTLSPDAQEALRKRAVAAVLGGMKQYEVAQVFGVSAYIVSQWVKRFRADGEHALDARPRGPAKGTHTLLTPKQCAMIRQVIIGKCPEQLRLPFFLWSREAVQELIRRKCGVGVSINTAGNYLRAWGFTVQKPVRRAYEQNAVAVQRWLAEQYPAIQRRAKADKALIYWGDEMGLRSDDQVGRSYGLRGLTPVIPGTGQRFGCNMISAVTNHGHLCFQVFEGSFNVKLFLGFLKRLVKQAKRKVFLIVDGHPSHRSRKVKEFVGSTQGMLRLFFLPPYTPEANPDELVWNNVKNHGIGRRALSGGVQELKRLVVSHLRMLQKTPRLIRGFFEHPHTRYAAEYVLVA